MVIKTAQIQFCAKVMQMEFGKFCYLFEQSSIESLNKILSKVWGLLSNILFEQKTPFCWIFATKWKIRGIMSLRLLVFEILLWTDNSLLWGVNFFLPFM